MPKTTFADWVTDPSYSSTFIDGANAKKDSFFSAVERQFKARLTTLLDAFDYQIPGTLTLDYSNPKLMISAITLFEEVRKSPLLHLMELRNAGKAPSTKRSMSLEDAVAEGERLELLEPRVHEFASLLGLQKDEPNKPVPSQSTWLH